ncbi:unnamed protein product [Clavelina lepadiformis]|uniref:Uncharacterized protein n=1 Tax=Clavelina lepadiformis TaxID=159417 RepID=A0ABP0GJ12_CLALP
MNNSSASLDSKLVTELVQVCCIEIREDQAVPCYKRTASDWMVPITMLQTVHFPDCKLSELEKIVQNETGCLVKMNNIEIKMMKNWLRREFEPTTNPFPHLTKSEVSCPLKLVKDNYSKFLKVVVGAMKIQRKVEQKLVVKKKGKIKTTSKRKKRIAGNSLPEITNKKDAKENQNNEKTDPCVPSKNNANVGTNTAEKKKPLPNDAKPVGNCDENVKVHVNKKPDQKVWKKVATNNGTQCFVDNLPNSGGAASKRTKASEDIPGTRQTPKMNLVSNHAISNGPCDTSNKGKNPKITSSSNCVDSQSAKKFEETDKAKEKNLQNGTYFVPAEPLYYINWPPVNYVWPSPMYNSVIPVDVGYQMVPAVNSNDVSSTRAVNGRTGSRLLDRKESCLKDVVKTERPSSLSPARMTSSRVNSDVGQNTKHSSTSSSKSRAKIDIKKFATKAKQPRRPTPDSRSDNSDVSQDSEREKKSPEKRQTSTFYNRNLRQISPHEDFERRPAPRYPTYDDVEFPRRDKRRLTTSPVMEKYFPNHHSPDPNCGDSSPPGRWNYEQEEFDREGRFTSRGNAPPRSREFPDARRVAYHQQRQHVGMHQRRRNNEFIEDFHNDPERGFDGDDTFRDYDHFRPARQRISNSSGFENGSRPHPAHPQDNNAPAFNRQRFDNRTRHGSPFSRKTGLTNTDRSRDSLPQKIRFPTNRDNNLHRPVGVGTASSPEKTEVEKVQKKEEPKLAGHKEIIRRTQTKHSTGNLVKNKQPESNANHSQPEIGDSTKPTRPAGVIKRAVEKNFNCSTSYVSSSLSSAKPVVVRRKVSLKKRLPSQQTLQTRLQRFSKSGKANIGNCKKTPIKKINKSEVLANGVKIGPVAIKKKQSRPEPCNFTDNSASKSSTELRSKDNLKENLKSQVNQADNQKSILKSNSGLTDPHLGSHLSDFFAMNKDTEDEASQNVALDWPFITSSVSWDCGVFDEFHVSLSGQEQVDNRLKEKDLVNEDHVIAATLVENATRYGDYDVDKRTAQSPDNSVERIDSDKVETGQEIEPAKSSEENDGNQPKQWKKIMLEKAKLDSNFTSKSPDLVTNPASKKIIDTVTLLPKESPDLDGTEDISGFHHDTIADESDQSDPSLPGPSQSFPEIENTDAEIDEIETKAPSSDVDASLFENTDLIHACDNSMCDVVNTTDDTSAQKQIHCEKTSSSSEVLPTNDGKDSNHQPASEELFREMKKRSCKIYLNQLPQKLEEQMRFLQISHPSRNNTEPKTQGSNEETFFKNNFISGQGESSKLFQKNLNREVRRDSGRKNTARKSIFQRKEVSKQLTATLGLSVGEPLSKNDKSDRTNSASIASRLLRRKRHLPTFNDKKSEWNNPNNSDRDLAKKLKTSPVSATSDQPDLLFPENAILQTTIEKPDNLQTADNIKETDLTCVQLNDLNDSEIESRLDVGNEELKVPDTPDQVSSMNQTSTLYDVVFDVSENTTVENLNENNNKPVAVTSKINATGKISGDEQLSTLVCNVNAKPKKIQLKRANSNSNNSNDLKLVDDIASIKPTTDFSNDTTFGCKFDGTGSSASCEVDAKTASPNVISQILIDIAEESHHETKSSVSEKINLPTSVNPIATASCGSETRGQVTTVITSVSSTNRDSHNDPYRVSTSADVPMTSNVPNSFIEVKKILMTSRHDFLKTSQAHNAATNSSGESNITNVMKKSTRSQPSPRLQDTVPLSTQRVSRVSSGHDSGNKSSSIPPKPQSSPILEPTSHGIMEVEMMAPSELLHIPGSNSGRTFLMRRRIPYVQAKSITSGGTTTSHQTESDVSSSQSSIGVNLAQCEVNLVRIRDVAFILRTNSSDVIKCVERHNLMRLPQNKFVKHVYDAIYNHLLEVPSDVFRAFKPWMLTSPLGLTDVDDLIKLQDVLRIIIPVFYDATFGIASKHLREYVCVKTYQTTSDVNAHVIQLFSDSFLYNLKLMNEDIQPKSNVTDGLSKQGADERTAIVAKKRKTLQEKASSETKQRRSSADASARMNSFTWPNNVTSAPPAWVDLPPHLLSKSPLTLVGPPTVVYKECAEATSSENSSTQVGASTPRIILPPSEAAFAASTSLSKETIPKPELKVFEKSGMFSNPPSSRPEKSALIKVSASDKPIQKLTPSSDAISKHRSKPSCEISNPPASFLPTMATSIDQASLPSTLMSAGANATSRVSLENELKVTDDETESLKRVQSNQVGVIPSKKPSIITVRFPTPPADEVKSEPRHDDVTSYPTAYGRDEMDPSVDTKEFQETFDDVDLKVDDVFSLAGKEGSLKTSEFFDDVLNRSTDDVEDDDEPDSSSIAGRLRQLTKPLGVTLPDPGQPSTVDDVIDTVVKTCRMGSRKKVVRRGRTFSNDVLTKLRTRLNQDKLVAKKLK